MRLELRETLHEIVPLRFCNFARVEAAKLDAVGVCRTGGDCHTLLWRRRSGTDRSRSGLGYRSRGALCDCRSFLDDFVRNEARAGTDRCGGCHSGRCRTGDRSRSGDRCRSRFDFCCVDIADAESHRLACARFCRSGIFDLCGCFGHHHRLAREIGQREVLRLTVVGDGGNAEQVGHAGLIILGTRERCPLRQACIELIGGHVFGGHDARCAPVACQSVGIGEVLTRLGGVFCAAIAHAVHEVVNAAFGLTGQSDRKTQIGGLKRTLVRGKLCQSGGVVAGRNLGQCIAQDSARIVFAKLQSVAECLGCGSEAACIEIGSAQHRAERGVARFGQNGGFGMADGAVDIAFRKRSLRLGKGGFSRRSRRGAPGERDAGQSGADEQAETRSRSGGAGAFGDKALITAVHVFFP